MLSKLPPLICLALPWVCGSLSSLQIVAPAILCMAAALPVIFVARSNRKRKLSTEDRFFNLSLDMLCTANFDGFFVRINPAFEQGLGYTREELLNTRFVDLIHPDDVARTAEVAAGLSRGEPCDVHENRYRAKDGSWHWLSWKAVSDMDAGLIYAAARDITEFRCAESRLLLRERDAQLQIAVGAALLTPHSLPDVLQTCCELIQNRLGVSLVRIWTIDSRDGTLDLQGSAGLLGTADGLSGTADAPMAQIAFGDLQIGQTAARRRPLFTNHWKQDSIDADRAFPGSDAIQAFAACPLVANEVVKGVLAVYSPQEMSLEEWRALEILSIDLSAALSRRRTQEALRKSETEARRLALVAARTSNAVVITNRDGDAEWVNEGFVRLTGYTFDEVRGRKPGEMIEGPKSDPAVLEQMRAAIRDGRAIVTELTNYRKDGTEFCVTIECQPIYDSKGQLSGFIKVATDITERKTAEERLRASEAYNRSIVESTQDCLEVLSANDALEEPPDTLNRVQPALRGWKEWLKQWHREDRAHASTALRDASSGIAHRFQARSPGDHQESKVWDVVVSPIHGADGKPEHLLAASRDVTEQRRNERDLRELNATLEERVEKRAAELAESQARFASAMHNSVIGMALLGLDGRWLEVNTALCEMFGRSSTELQATDFQTLTHPDDIAADMEQVARLISGEIASYQMEKRYLHRDGSIIWGHLSVPLARSQLGVPLHFISQVQDVTERKRAELQLTGSEERFRLMVEHVEDYAIFMLDPYGCVISWNKGAERTTGYTSAEIVGAAFAKFQPATPGAEASPADLLSIARQIGQAKDEGWYLRKDGNTFYADVRLTALTDPASGLRGYAVVMHDLTKRRETEAHALRSQRLESIGNLASGVAHDLNNSLGPIMMGLGVLRDLYPQEDEIIESFVSCGRRASDMVKQLLTFARGAEGERVTVQTSYLLKELCQIMTGTLPKNITTFWDYTRDLMCIHGDPTQVHQILLNLCVNARDAMPSGGTLTVTARNVEVDEVFASAQAGATPGNYVRIDVSDTGEGITPEIIDRIFEPFFTTKSPDKGTGLGLATVLGLVKSHGGFLRVYSPPKEGATFSVFLPATMDESPALDLPATPEMLGSGEKILVVDDESAIRDVSSRVLRRLNFEAITATDGADALVKAAEIRHELQAIVTDMHMPHMDGLALVRAVRRVLPEIPVIIASGRLEDHDRREFQKLNVAGFLHKPFTQDEMGLALRKALHPETSPDAVFA